MYRPTPAELEHIGLQVAESLPTPVTQTHTHYAEKKCIEYMMSLHVLLFQHQDLFYCKKRDQYFQCSS